MNDAEQTHKIDSTSVAKIKVKMGWLLLLLGALLMIGILLPFEWLGHQTGFVGLLSIFLGVSLLKKRKDQLARK